MASLEYWLRGGVVIKSGTQISGSVGGFPPVDATEGFTFTSDHTVTGINGGFTEFSASSLDNLEYTLKVVTGEGVKIPRKGNQSNLFNGAYSDKSFFDHANTVPSHQDSIGSNLSAVHKNCATGSIVDGVVGN